MNKNMIKYFVLFCGMGLMSNLMAQSDEVLIPLNGDHANHRLKINIFQGEITVKGTERQDVKANYAVITQDSNDSDSFSTDKNGLKKISGGNLDLEMSSSGNTTLIKSHNWNKNIRFEIEVPKNMDINIQKNIGGSVTVVDVQGSVNIENNVGDVVTKNIRGIVNASTNAGALKIHFAEIPEAKNMMFTTTTGSIDISLPPQFDVDLVLKTEMGEIYSDLDLTIENKVPSPSSEQKDGVFKYSHSDHTYAKVGSGGPEISVTSRMGSIYLRENK